MKCKYYCIRKEKYIVRPLANIFFASLARFLVVYLNTINE